MDDDAILLQRHACEGDQAAADRDRKRLAELRRPMEVDVISSTLKAKLMPGETVVTGGALMPSGLRLFVFGKPEQQDYKGRSVVSFEGKYVAISEEAAAKEPGLQALMTNAANTLQHGEVWAPGEQEAVLARLSAAKSVDVLSAPKVTLLSGNEAEIHVGDEVGMRVKPTVQADGALDLELRSELVMPPEVAGKAAKKEPVVW